MSATKEDSDDDAIASCCSHGGEEPMAIADRSHEPRRMPCTQCLGQGYIWLSDGYVARVVTCHRCTGVGIEPYKRHR